MRLTPEELSARKKRNLALAGALVAALLVESAAPMMSL